MKKNHKFLTKLERWAIDKYGSRIGLCRKLGVTGAAFFQWQLKGVLPRKDTIISIFHLSDGYIDPNYFFLEFENECIKKKGLIKDD